MLSLSQISDDLLQTKIELSSFYSPLASLENIYLSSKSRFPAYQLKYLEMVGFYVPPEVKTPEFFSDFSRIERVSTVLSHKNLPNFREIPSEDLDAVRELFGDKQLLNYHYVQGKLFERDSNFFKALGCYEEGAKSKEQLAMIEMFKVLVEPKEAQKFSIKTDHKRAVSILLDNFLENGLFDNVSKSRESIYGVYLLYVFLDCFPDFLTFVQAEAKENSFLEFLLLQSLEESKAEIPVLMKNIDFEYSQKKDLLLGDLYHAFFLGISNELEFNIRQYHYQSAIKQGNWNGCSRTGWINQIYLDLFMRKLDVIEGRLALETEKTPELEQQKASTLDFISKTKKNYYSSFSILKKKSQYKYSEDYLSFLLETNESLLPKNKADKNNCLACLNLLRLLGSEEALPHLFSILILRRKFDLTSQAETHEEMKKLAERLKGKSNRELCYCMEKGIGFERNLSKIFQYYHDEIFLFFEDDRKLRYCLFRVGKLLEKTGKSDFATIFLEVCLLKTVNALKRDFSFEDLYYLAKVYRRSSVGKDLAYSTAILILIQEKLTGKSHLDLVSRMILFGVNRKLQVLKPENQEKLTFALIMAREAKNIEERLKKASFYDHFIKDDLASFINQTFRTFLIKIDDKVPIERTLSPNLRYKKTMHFEPEFSPYVIKKLKKIELFSHFFTEAELEVGEDYGDCGDSKVLRGVIKRNRQLVAVKEFGFRMDDIDPLIDFLNRLEFSIKLNCKAFLPLLGFSYCKKSEKIIAITVVFNGFADFLHSSLKSKDKPLELDFSRVAAPVMVLSKSGLNFVGLTLEKNFVIGFDRNVIIADFELNLFYKDQKTFLDISTQKKILTSLEIRSPPELFKSFSLRSENISLGSTLVWSLAWTFIDFTLKLKPVAGKEQFNSMEKGSAEKYEGLVKELLANEPLLKPYVEPLKRALSAEKPSTPKQFLQDLKLDLSKLITEIEENPCLFKAVSFGSAESQPSKGTFFLQNKGLYEGEVQDFSPHGTGCFSVKSVNYEGKFDRGRLEGSGRYRSNEWEMRYEGNFSENIAKQGFFLLVNQKNNENSSFGNHIYTEFEKEFSLPNAEAIGKMMEGFGGQITGIMEKIKGYRGYFNGFLKTKDKFQRISDYRANLLFYKDDSLKEFIVRKLDLIDNFVLIFNETISTKEVFYFDQMSFGLFELEKALKSPSMFSSQLFEAPIKGELISYFGRKIAGSFLDFKPLVGYKYHNFLNFTSFNNLQLIYQGTLKSIKDGKRDYSGSIINEKAHGYGEETFNDTYIYKGFYRENEPHGKGVLQEKSGKALIKGYFRRGLPMWGTYHKDREIKYKGNFIFAQEGTIFTFKTIKEMIDGMVIKGFLLKNDEKILAQYGTFQKLEEELISGISKIEYKNGVIFEGNLNQSLKKGKGRLSIKKGPADFMTADGDWDNDKLRGIIKWDKSNEFGKSSGSFTFVEGPNGTLTPKMDGFGLIEFKNGARFAGGFIENRMQGIGTFSGERVEEKTVKTTLFFGSFEDGKRGGFGVLKESSKENESDFLVYKGGFRNDKKHGYGLVYRREEKVLEGIFEEGVFKSGWLYVNDKVIEKIEAGVFDYSEAKDVYSPRGFGTVYLKDGNKVECLLDNIVDDITEKKLKRIGILITETGSFFEGLIDMFKIHGLGSYRNGAKMLYEGEFKYGQFQGFGRVYDKKGRVYQGGFEKGLKSGFGREVDENEENIFRGYWKNGVREGFGKIGRSGEEKKEEFFVSCQGMKINKIVKV